MSETTKWGRKLITVASTVALAVGGTIAVGTSAQAANAALYLNYESNDTLATKAAGFNLGTGGSATVAAGTGSDTTQTLKIVKAADADPWGGATILADGDTANTYVDATHTTITLDYFNGQSAASPVSLEVTAPGACKAGRTAEAAVGWSTLTFDFSLNSGWSYCMGVNAQFTILAIEPNFNATYQNGNDGAYSGAAASANNGETYNVDNISINGGDSSNVVTAPPAPRTAPATVITYESDDTTGYIPSGGFEGAEASAVVTTPTGGNPGHAMKIVKSVRAWSGINIINTGVSTRITNAAHPVVTMAFYSPETTTAPVMLKIENSSLSARKVAYAAPGWSILTFDMSTGTGWSDSTEYYKMGIFPGFADPDLNATSSNVTPSGQFYYVDNIAYNGGVTPALPVAAVAPAHTVAASITGTAKVGKTLTAKKGTWTGTATITYAYKWYRCTKAATAATSAVPTSAAKCSAISGTAATHKLVAADKGKYIRVLVTATNTAGSAKSLSKTTAKIG